MIGGSEFECTFLNGDGHNMSVYNTRFEILYIIRIILLKLLNVKGKLALNN